ncbi:putative MFS transporter [Bombardia bombarda]|uniref:MFS transporter n=1 Tax=Bombardia bombarda TaxID=252184 RepID=A0AA39WGB6_9PEZI|nr:putative MFS transporter [Bombardia bombarda]
MSANLNGGQAGHHRDPAVLNENESQSQTTPSSEKDAAAAAAAAADGSSSSGPDTEKQSNTAPEPNAMQWDGPGDPENPKNFSLFKRTYITVMLALLVFMVAFASSVMSPTTEKLAEEFHLSSEVCILATALFVLGFAFGPLIFGPASEVLGRKQPLAVGLFLFGIFTIPVAVAKNAATVFVCRFLTGTFGSSSLAIVGGTLADIWEPLSRGVAVAGFASATFLGPVMGPIVGGFVTKSYLGWRWTQWLTLIPTMVLLAIFYVTVPETFAPVLLQKRAKRRGLDTGDAGKKGIDWGNLVRVYLFRPWIMIALEPILALITLYIGFVYGFLYLCFEAYPIAFAQERGWSLGVAALPFLAITVGVLVAVVIIIVHTKTRMKRKVEQFGDVPEERLVPMMIGSILMPAGMFWFACEFLWELEPNRLVFRLMVADCVCLALFPGTSNPNISWVPQVISGSFIGCGILLVFLQGLNYLIDVYKITANSAIAINAMFRGLLGAGFPMFANYMFQRLGVPWAMSLLAFLNVALIPVPFLFYIYGARIRKWSKFTP